MDEQTEIKRLLEKTGIGQTEIATWLGCAPRTVRHYVKGTRQAERGLILLLEYLSDRPEATAWFRDRFATAKKGKLKC